MSSSIVPQSAIPKPLIWYLEATEEAQVAIGLNKELGSPFKNRIALIGMRPNHLYSLPSVARQIKRLFSLGGVQDLDVDEKIEFMSQFWTIIADQLDEEWSDIEKLDDPETKGQKGFKYKLLEPIGLVAWAYTGAHIFMRSYSEGTGMNWEQVRHLVKAVSGIDWRKNGKYKRRRGETGGKAMADEMIRLLPAEVPEISLQQALS